MGDEKQITKIIRQVIYCLFILWGVFIFFGTILILLPESPRRPLIAATDWNIISGNFFPNGEPKQGDLPCSVITSPDAKFWRSWAPDCITDCGHIRSASFFIRSNVMELPVVGYPAAPGNRIYLKNMITGEERSFRYGNAHETWQLYLVNIPHAWQGSPLCVGAESCDKRRYVGIGTPYEIGRITQLKRSFPVCLAWSTIICFLLFLITIPFNKLLQKIIGKQSTQIELLFFPLAAMLLGYVLFFFYYASPMIGGFFSILSLISGFVFKRKNIWQMIRQPKIFFTKKPTLLLWIILVGFSWLVLNSQHTISVDYAANYRFSPACWSTDNQIPITIAKALAQGKSLHGLLGLWQVSDRPPALVGLGVPLCQLTNWFFADSNSSQLGGWLFNLLGICVMATWVFPIWECLKIAGLQGKMRCYAISLLMVSPFIFFNTVYVWPKLISATLAFMGWLFLNRLKRDSIREPVVAGLSFGAALMCHGSIFFGLCAMGALCFTRLWKLQRNNLLLVGVTCLLTILPWLFFVKKIDPPGNALTKYTFAGTCGFNEKNKSLLETVKEAYKNDTVESWKYRKSLLIKTFFGYYKPLVGCVGYPDPGLAVRSAQFYYLIPTLGLLMIPFLFGTYFYYLNKEKVRVRNNFSADTFLRLGIIGVLMQGLVSWDPFVLHHLAYSSIFCLHLTAIIYLCQFTAVIRNSFLIIWMMQFGIIWIISPALEFNSVNIVNFIGSLILLVLLCVINYASQKQFYRIIHQGIS
ncbi:MAG: hypothetical protein K2W99_04920 [Chthoniobacterales bacterium]|nr:hypothetical protein [Chthoniobacterales bacterium]